MSGHTLPSSQPAALAPTPGHAGPVRLFITEDDAVIAMDLRFQLERAGYTVVGSAMSGEEALRGVASTQPDLVLMDIVIKGAMDGIATAERLRQQHAVPVLFLTAYADETTLLRARSAGAYGYLVKPFRMHELRAAIEIALYKREMERALHLSEARFHGAFDHAAIGMALLDPSGQVIQVNRALEELLGRDADALVGGHFDQLAPQALTSLRERILSGAVRSLQVECTFDRGDGVTIWAMVSLASVLDEARRPTGLIAQLQDVTERKRVEAQLLQLAMYDAVTGLLNRAHLMERLGYALTRAQRRQSRLALLFVDLDRFTQINDQLGPARSDELLKEVAQRIQRVVRASDSVGRWGGDEMVVVAPDVQGRKEAAVLAEKILAALALPYMLGTDALSLDVSMGIALYPGDGETAAGLVQQAELVMYSAKQHLDGCRYAFAGADPDPNPAS